jgi:glycine cleavage system H protein
MSVIIILIACLVLLSAGYITLLWGKKSTPERVTDKMITLPVSRDLTSISEPFFHPSHSWARITDELVTVGADEFAYKLIGKIQRIEIAQMGSYLKQGQIIWVLCHNDRALPQCAPVEGQIVEINRELVQNPSRIGDHPYDRDWIARIRPYSLRQNLKNLIRNDAARYWLNGLRDRLVMQFSTEIGPTCQDGGDLVTGVSDLLNEQEWEAVLFEYFSIDT